MANVKDLKVKGKKVYLSNQLEVVGTDYLIGKFIYNIRKKQIATIKSPMRIGGVNTAHENQKYLNVEFKDGLSKKRTNWWLNENKLSLIILKNTDGDIDEEATRDLYKKINSSINFDEIFNEEKSENQYKMSKETLERIKEISKELDVIIKEVSIKESVERIKKELEEILDIEEKNYIKVNCLDSNATIINDENLNNLFDAIGYLVIDTNTIHKLRKNIKHCINKLKMIK